ncbi:MAG: hypothetical protein M1350_02620 [Actinobacteria bacterium]|nr:hypothetical protein [Actinomycetota bacterium]
MDEYYSMKIASISPVLTKKYQELASMVDDDPGLAVMLEELAEHIAGLVTSMSQHDDLQVSLAPGGSLPAGSAQTGGTAELAEAVAGERAGKSTGTGTSDNEPDVPVPVPVPVPISSITSDRDAILSEVQACLAIVEEIASDEEGMEGYGEMIAGAFLDKIALATLEIISPFLGENTTFAIDSMFW